MAIKITSPRGLDDLGASLIDFNLTEMKPKASAVELTTDKKESYRNEPGQEAVVDEGSVFFSEECHQRYRQGDSTLNSTMDIMIRGTPWDPWALLTRDASSENFGRGVRRLGPPGLVAESQLLTPAEFCSDAGAPAIAGALDTKAEQKPAPPRRLL
ncbi:hypothetical protein DVH05_027004 [Phytophthora capsici]|nr:hypothetical protein DVH05_027004 [Phytophthora capsici]